MPRKRGFARVQRLARPLLCAATLLLFLRGADAAALCADASGDGYIRASDALATLRAAVASTYNTKLDVYPVEAPDGMLSAADAAVVLRAAADTTIPECAASDEERIVDLTLASCDFVTGAVATIDVRSRQVLSEQPGVTEVDAVIRRQGELLFALNRSRDNAVMELDPSNDLVPLWNCSVGGGSNPHDIVLVAPDKGYVTRYDSTKLAIIDPSAGPNGCAGFLTGTIDLSAYADADGWPEMDQMTLVGEELFVALQRLDRNSFFRPYVNGEVVVIDTKTDAVTDVIELSIQNPFIESKGLYRDPVTGVLWVAGPGRLYTDFSDGGIERIDPATHTSLGVVATGADLGGDLVDLVVVGAHRAYALVAGKGFRVSLVEIDLATGAPRSVLASSTESISDIEITQAGQLWAADRKCSNPGVRVFSIADNRELTPEPIKVTLSPSTLVFSR